ncbi:MAG TPA: hypothetical protein VF242_10750 [Nitrososphaeraceae archaeon]
MEKHNCCSWFNYTNANDIVILVNYYYYNNIIIHAAKIVLNELQQSKFK